MDYEYIKYLTLQVFKECSINSFPIDCHTILKHYDLDVLPYSSLDIELRAYCLKFSDDAFLFKRKIFFNNNMPTGRIRFSLMHELGHIILKHHGIHTSEQEQEANFFSSILLAPRMAIHYARCKNYHDVTKHFRITYEAGQYAFNDYRRWYRYTVYHKMKTFDKLIYAHFYNESQNKFIYSIKRCVYCGEEIYNTVNNVCNKCISPNSEYTYYNLHNDNDLSVAESQWLYGGI